MTHYIKEADNAIGTILILISVLGTFFNALTLMYFILLKPKNEVGQFFKFLYMVITATDMLVCMTLAPMIDAAVAEDREGMLARSSGLCSAWAILWGCTIPQMTIFLVGMLSVCRLLVLWTPTRKLKARLAYILPASLFIVIVITYSTVMNNEIVFPKYIPSWIACHISNVSPLSGKEYVTQRDKNINIYLILLPLNVIPAFSIFPISISFILTLICLKRSRIPSRSMRGHTIKQREAAKTILAVTTTYILLNFPYAVGMLMALRSSLTCGGILEQGKEVTHEEYYKTCQLPEELYLLTNYFVPINSVLFVGLNSLLNPVIYFWRVKLFRQWIFCRITEQKRTVKPTKQATPKLSFAINTKPRERNDSPTIISNRNCDSASEDLCGKSSTKASDIVSSNIIDITSNFDPDKACNSRSNTADNFDPDKACNSRSNTADNFDPDKACNSRSNTAGNFDPNKACNSRSNTADNFDPDKACNSRSNTAGNFDPDKACNSRSNTASNFDPDKACNSRSNTADNFDPDKACNSRSSTASNFDPDKACNSRSNTAGNFDPHKACNSRSNTASNFDPHKACNSRSNIAGNFDPDRVCKFNNSVACSSVSVKDGHKCTGRTSV